MKKDFFIIVCAILGFVSGFITTYIAKQVIEEDQFISKNNSEIRKTISEKINEITDGVFVVSSHGKDNRIIRFTLVCEDDDPEIMLEVIEEGLINKLIEVGFWTLEITTKSHIEIIVIDLHEKTVKKKKIV